jgi:hypothetical protein
MCTLLESYRNCEWISKEADLKMQFIDFLLEFKADEVAYGIAYLKEKEIGLYEMLYPIILDYNTYGLKHFIEEPPKETVDEDVNLSWFERIKSFFKSAVNSGVGK